MSLPKKVATSYANLIVRRPLAVLALLVALAIGSGYASSLLRVNSNQLDLISQDLREVKDVKRVVDMVGGAGHLIFALRSDNEQQMKTVADELAAMLLADKENVRNVTWKLPVDFIQQNMVLFVKTEDLVEVKKRVNTYLEDQLRRASPFFIEFEKTEPVKLEVQDIVDKYTTVAKRSILDEYSISNDKQMLLLVIKPMWDSNELDKTGVYLEKLKGDLAQYSKTNPHGVKLVEDYDLVGSNGTIAYGFTGSYKLSLDDSAAVVESLKPTTLISFAGILLIMILFFRRPAPIVIIASGMILGTLLTMGFTYVTIGTLNLITSILAGILMGLGVDFGFHFTYRARLELGSGKPFEVAIRDAIVNAGVPAFISCIATSGAFFALLLSEFRGFSQFGFLAGCGNFLIGLTLFSWPPALLVLLGRKNPEWPAKLIGTAQPPKEEELVAGRIPRPKLVIAIASLVVLVMAAFALPLGDFEPPADRPLTLLERLQTGVRFNYNTRALIPEDRSSVKLQDEIGERFDMSADPVAVYTPTLEDAREVYDALTPLDREKFSTLDSVVSIFTFVPPQENAKANEKVLAEWKQELQHIDPKSLPPEVQDKAELFFKILDAKAYDVDGVPANYRSQFQHLPSTRPENHGWLTFIYPQVDLWDGKQMLKFADQTSTIVTKSGKEFHAAGQPTLFAKLARIVLWDAKVTVALTAVWILIVLLLDFRNLKVALASLIPLALGMGMMLGTMALLDEQLNFMNIVMLPIVLGYGVSHGVYLVHRYLEGVAPLAALKTVGAAVASSTLTTVAGFAALLFASHNGLRSMGLVTCIGLVTTLLVSFTLLAAVLQLMHDRRVKLGQLPQQAATPAGETGGGQEAA